MDEPETLSAEDRRRGSFIWLAAALIFFVGAAFITYHVTSVAKPDDPDASDLSVHATGTAGTVVALRVSADERGTKLTFPEIPNGVTHIYLNALTDRGDCVFRHHQLPVPGKEPIVVTQAAGTFQRRNSATIAENDIDLDGLGPDYSDTQIFLGLKIRGTIECDLPPLLRQETFVSRDLRVDLGGVLPVQMELVEPDATLIHLTDRRIGTTFEGVSTPSSTSDSWLVQWDSDAFAALRDTYFVIVGTLVALGASSLIEALRPYFDIYLAWRRDNARRR
jgi:hypothetical protein